MIALALMLAAAPCEGCHAEQHAQWLRSRHATAAANPLYLASWEHHQQRRWCQGCHLPAADDGCASCHLPGTEHGGARVEAKTCAKCHDFDVPEAFGVGKGPMQNTYDEWRTSKAAAAGRTCGSCHDHAARSGHDPAVLRAALQLDVRRTSGRVHATVSARDTGHALPTGDPFRRLMLTVGALKKLIVVPADRSLELDLGATDASTWQLTAFHAEVEVAGHEHAFLVTEGTVRED